MKRRSCNPLAALLAIAITAYSRVVSAAATPKNVIFLLSESLDGRLLREGSKAAIPNIRALLAAGGVRFDSAYSNNPVCAPSRSSLHSGRAPHKIPHLHNGLMVNGVWNNWEGLPTSGPMAVRLDDILNASGYATAMLGKQDYTVGSHTLTSTLSSITMNIKWPYNITADGGWNEEDGACASDAPVSPGGSAGASGSSYGSDWKIIEKMSSFASTAPEPFYVFGGTSILHPPYQTTRYWFERANTDAGTPEWPPLDTLHPCDLQASMKRGCTPGNRPAAAYADFYDPARRARVRRVYLAELEEFDAMVGALVAALKAAGRWTSETFLFLAADHGDMQLERQLYYKMLPYDASTRVPLVVFSPALAAGGGRVITQPVSLLDIFPTVLSLAAVPVPPYADGYDLAPLFVAPSDPLRPPFVASQNADEDISMSWSLVVNGTHKLVQYGTGVEVPPQLFDLIADPNEKVNLYNTTPAADAAFAALDAQLKTLIDYPAVAMDIAAYQLEQFRWWTANGTTDWRKEIASSDVRWQAAWAAHPAEALAAAEDYLATQGAPMPVPCSGALARGV